MTHESQKLLELLTNGHPHRQVYIAANGSGWYVTHQRGAVSTNAVRELIDDGYIQSCYSNCPAESYHVGKTLDVEATIEERKRHRRGKDAPLIYTDGSQSPKSSATP